MNTNEMKILLTVSIAGAISLILFAYLRRFFYLLKTSNQAQPLQNGKRFDGRNSNLKNRRRRIESNPNVICSLPMHQESRPEMRMY